MKLSRDNRSQKARRRERSEWFLICWGLGGSESKWYMVERQWYNRTKELWLDFIAFPRFGEEAAALWSEDTCPSVGFFKSFDFVCGRLCVSVNILHRIEFPRIVRIQKRSKPKLPGSRFPAKEDIITQHI
jgi:hypothetical protein